MTPDAVRSLKREISDDVAATFPDTPEARAFLATTEPPMPAGVALGLARREDGQHVLAIRATSLELAQPLVARARGEADVRIVHAVAPRPPPSSAQAVDAMVARMQSRQRPLEPGLQIQMRGKNFVGTLGFFARDNVTGALCAVTNSHVAADEGKATPGHVIGQPFGNDPVGTLMRFVPFSRSAPNLVDVALVRLDPGIPFSGSFTAAINGRIRGVRELREDDLGREFFKIGRTTAVRAGRLTALEVDGLPVLYTGATLTFDNQGEWSGGPTTDLSAGGDSGSAIVDADGWLVGLLFAGGPDQHGQDRTFGNRATNALHAVGASILS